MHGQDKYFGLRRLHKNNPRAEFVVARVGENLYLQFQPSQSYTAETLKNKTSSLS
jgi:hypothetical protein